MAEGHVTDPAGMEKIRIYLGLRRHLTHPQGNCPLHQGAVQLIDDHSKIVMKGCCRAFIAEQLDHISQTIDWFEFYNSIETPG